VNGNGQLGDGTTTNRLTPALVAGGGFDYARLLLNEERRSP
jgi:hypothetical protein